MPKKTRFYQNKTFWAWFILIIMVLSSAGLVMNYRTNDTTKPKVYNNLKFYPTQSGYMAVVNNQQLFFLYFPADLESIPMDADLDINSEKVYLVFDPDDELRFDNPMNRLGSIVYGTNRRYVKACIQDEGCPDIPVVDCEESTSKFYFKESNTTQIYTDRTCTVLNAGSKEDMEKIVELIYFKILGIME